MFNDIVGLFLEFSAVLASHAELGISHCHRDSGSKVGQLLPDTRCFEVFRKLLLWVPL